MEKYRNNEYYLATKAFIMYNVGNIDKAKEYYNDALKINPNLEVLLYPNELKV